MARRKYTVDYNQPGYAGDAMSIGAVQAYRKGAMPISRWTKAALVERIVELGGSELCGLLTVKQLQERYLIFHSWHHTGVYANSTNFYCIDAEKVQECTDDTLRAEFGEEKANTYLKRLQSAEEKAPSEKKASPKDTWVGFVELPEDRVEFVRMSKSKNRIVRVRCIDKNGEEFFVEGVERHLYSELFRIPFEEYQQSNR